MNDMGLSKIDHWLAYRWKGGFGYPWMPKWLQHLIADIWNFFACRKYGHQIIGDIGNGEVCNECMHCCKKIDNEGE